MKRLFLLTIIVLFVAVTVNAQFKIHQNGKVSFQSLTTSGGVQIDSTGKCSFEPNIMTSYSSLTQAKIQSQLVRAWSIRYLSDPPIYPEISFFVTGLGDVYSNGQYSINPGGNDEKGYYPIENASNLISNLKGYYYDYDKLKDFEPDFIGNPNINPEAVEGLMKDIAIDKTLGLSVDELETILPEAIRHGPEGKIYINYSAIVPVIVEAFKEQQAKIEQMEAVLKKSGLLNP